MRTLKAILVGAALAGACGVAWWLRGQVGHAAQPDAQAIIERVREVARLETLDVTLSKVVGYAPDPPPSASLAGALATWAVYSVNPPEGRAQVVGVAHLGLDVAKLDASRVHVTGDTVRLDLPPVRATLELLPDRTEIMRSNLDSAQTAELLAKAKRGLEADVAFDRELQARARASAELAIAKLLKTLGFRVVQFGAAGPAA